MKVRGGMSNGVFGCAVIGIIILASLGLAFLGNAEERQADTTDWNYVTSANPAFTYDQAPARVEYSPPANITGYTTDTVKSEYISGVEYTPTSAPNSYLVKRAPVLLDLVDTDLSTLYNPSAGLPPLYNSTTISQSNRNVIVGLSGHETTWGAYLMQFGYWQRAISNLSAVELDNNTSIEFDLIDDNSFFAIASDYGMSYVVKASPSPTHSEYNFSGATPCNRAVLNINGLVNLYSNGTYIMTASASDVILGVGNFDGTLNTAAPLDGAEVTVSFFQVITEYINPNNGVSPIPASQTTPPMLTSISNLNPNTTYNGFNLSGAAIIADGLEDLDFRYSITVLAGSPCYVSNHIEVHGGIFYGTNEFNWTPTQAGNYVFALAERNGNMYEITYQGTKYVVDYPVFLSITVIEFGTVHWFNGYENAAIDLMVKSFEGTIQAGGVPISCASSSWTVGGVAVGTWPAVIVTYDMDAGVYVTPVVSFTNFNAYATYENAVTVNTTAGSPRDSLTFYAPVNVTLSVVHTEIYLSGGGVYRVDSYLDVSAKFPNYDTYNITITGAAHWGDSITINSTACAVDKAAGTVEISGVKFPLAGLVLAYSDSAFYYKGSVYEAGHLVAINGGLAVDLGEAEGLVLEFDGTWYYETALYAGAAGTVTVVDWTPGVLGLDASAFAAVFTLMALAGLVLASRLGGGTWDYLIIGSAVLVGFIMCGVFM